MAEKVREEANVLVTGMGPFMHIPVNASYCIASTLPSTISAVSPNPNSTLKRTNIHCIDPAVRTSYRDVRTRVPEFFAEHADLDVDLVLHMGVGHTNYYSLETQSFRDGYNVYDDYSGERARDLSDLPGGEHMWRDVYGAPPVLKTDVRPTSELYARTMALLQTKAGEARQRADVRLSYDPGQYLCGFIYYEGLVERWHAGEEGNVLFLHVRPWINDETLHEGREVAMALIRAAVGMVEEKRMREDERSGKRGGLGECCVVS